MTGRRPGRRLGELGVAAGLALLTLGCGGGEPAPGSVTWAEDVAPILHANCATCHRPGSIAPFSLLTYDDARRRASQIAEVTTTGFMPPWLPAPGESLAGSGGDGGEDGGEDGGTVRFAGERRLSDGEISTLAAWAAADAPRGDPAAAPPVPEFPSGWQLGEPDLVITMEEAFVVPAEGRDVFRNFVLPTPVDEPRWVKTLELRSDNPVVVHHVILQVDDTGAARRRDAEDPGPGFGGMDLADSRMPDGQFLGWTPGRVPDPGLPGVAWRATPGMDLTLQLHLTPTGRPEPVTASVGLHFADAPPTRHPFGLMLGSEEIDIPPGTRGYEVRDRFRLPVPVEALGIYPHAHYLGDTMEVWATLPDGSRRGLLSIPQWDFNWQDEYRYAEPVPLPAGSVVEMRYTYDNTADNPWNPYSPPRRVTYGYQSSDEMGFLLLRLLPESEEDRDRLHVAQLEHSLEKRPGDWRALAQLGQQLLGLGRLQEAVAALERARGGMPADAEQGPTVLTHLGQALGRLGRLEEALPVLATAARRGPTLPQAQVNYGVALQLAGRLEEAEARFRRALELAPESATARLNLARLLAATGRREEARSLLAPAAALAEGRGS